MAGKLDHVGWGCGLGLVRCTGQMLGDQCLDVLDVEQVALVHEAHVGDASDLLAALDPVIDRARHPQDT